MRALVFEDKGLHFRENHPLPIAGEGEALIRVLLAGICNTDVEIARGYMGFEGILGHEFVGIVEALSGEQTQAMYGHLLGQRVVGEINAACRKEDCWYCQRGIYSQCPERTTLGIVNRPGAFAEYVVLPVENLHLVPDQVKDEDAVFVEPLAANFQILEQVHIRPTERILILGDGKMGQLAAQVLTLSGAEVTMLGKHEEKLALVKARGVRTRLLSDPTIVQERRFDVVVDCTGSASGLEMSLRFVRPQGTLILKSTVAEKSQLHLAPLVIDEIRVQGSRCGPFAPALRALSQKLITVEPFVSAIYPFAEALPAFTYAQQQGVLKVLLRIAKQ